MCTEKLPPSLKSVKGAGNFSGAVMGLPSPINSAIRGDAGACFERIKLTVNWPNVRLSLDANTRICDSPTAANVGSRF